MTKTPSKRTHPLDRDGDGAPGGSLPGNQTAPMAAPEADEDTFDAEQVAASQAGAGEGAVIQEEGETVADPATAAVPLADALVTVQTDTAPVAVRIRELRILTDSRRLYKSEQGYSASYGAPFIDQSTVAAWVKAGLAEYVPSAGREGGVRCTHAARAALTRARLEGAA